MWKMRPFVKFYLSLAEADRMSRIIFCLVLTDKHDKHSTVKINNFTVNRSKQRPVRNGKICSQHLRSQWWSEVKGILKGFRLLCKILIIENGMNTHTANNTLTFSDCIRDNRHEVQLLKGTFSVADNL